MSRRSDEKFFWRKDLREETSPSNDDDSAEETTTFVNSNQEQGMSSIVRNSPSSSSASKLFPQTKLIIGIPVHNSERTIAKTVIELLQLNVDIVVCDDASTDATEEIARELGCKLIKHPRQLGLSDSITSIFLASRRLRASNLLTADPEMDFTLRDALNLLERVQSGECDIAIGTDRSREDSSSDETVDHIRDPYSLFRAYGKRALALIAPAGTTSIVMESDVLEFAKQQGLRVVEYPISSAPSDINRQQNWASRIKSIPSVVESAFSRTVGNAALRHPLLFFGTPAIGMLIATGIQTIETFQLWSATGAKPDYGFYYAGFDLVLSLILGVGALILESQNQSRIRNR